MMEDNLIGFYCRGVFVWEVGVVCCFGVIFYCFIIVLGIVW